MVEPPCVEPEPVKLYTNAPTMRFTSTPLCSRKRVSSMAMNAFCSISGISSRVAYMRFSLPLKSVIRLP